MARAKSLKQFASSLLQEIFFTLFKIILKPRESFKKSSKIRLKRFYKAENYFLSEFIWTGGLKTMQKARVKARTEVNPHVIRSQSSRSK